MLRSLLVLVSLALFVSCALSAATKTFNPASTANCLAATGGCVFSNPDIWEPVGEPQANDSVLIDGSDPTLLLTTNADQVCWKMARGEGKTKGMHGGFILRSS